MKIAVEGCCHGELDKIYGAMKHLEHVEGITIDLLICCGDFQAVRNLDDLECMSVPNKYKELGTFYKYYSGEAVAPYPTLFIGGNHEASNYLWELYYGGWVCPNIYYLGHSGVINFGDLRIGGLSVRVVGRGPGGNLLHECRCSHRRVHALHPIRYGLTVFSLTCRSE